MTEETDTEGMLKFSSEQRDMFNNDEEALACFCGE